MISYPAFLRKKLYECIYARKSAQQQLQSVVDSIAKALAEQGSETLRGHVQIRVNGTFYSFVGIQYCDSDTYDDDYKTVTFDAVLVANNLADFDLAPNDARLCLSSLRKQVGEMELDHIRSISVNSDAVVVYTKSVPVEELPNCSFSVSEIIDYFAQKP